MKPSFRESRALHTLLAGVTLGVLAWCVSAASRRLGEDHIQGDFRHFYFAAQAMMHGQDIYTSWRNGYLYPPLVAFLYLPLGMLPVVTAAAVDLGINTLLVLVNLVLGTQELSRRFESPRSITMALAAGLLATLVMADKIKGELQMWQTDMLVLLSYTLALRWLDRRPWLAGLALGFGFNIKFQTLLALPYLLARRRWLAAAWFCTGIVVFAFLPAIFTGLRENLRELGVAFSGVLDLVGVKTGLGVSTRNPIDIGFSVSVTSALGRLIGGQRFAALVMLAAGAVGVAYAGACLWMYRRAKIPALVWPPSAEQGRQPFRAMVGVEWAGLIVATLAFSPQTNPRHLSQALLPVIAAAIVLLRLPTWRQGLPLIVGIALFFLGLVMPPGELGWTGAQARWFAVGGPSWCLLIMYAALVWTLTTQVIGADGARARGPMRDPGLPGRPVRRRRADRTGGDPLLHLLVHRLPGWPAAAGLAPCLRFTP